MAASITRASLEELKEYFRQKEGREPSVLRMGLRASADLMLLTNADWQEEHRDMAVAWNTFVNGPAWLAKNDVSVCGLRLELVPGKENVDLVELA